MSGRWVRRVPPPPHVCPLPRVLPDNLGMRSVWRCDDCRRRWTVTNVSSIDGLRQPSWMGEAPRAKRWWQR